MRTKFFFFAALASVTLVSCSSDDFIADAPPVDGQEYGVPIMFSSLNRGMTRADFVGAEAASLLNNKFVVSGYKGSKSAWQATEDATTTPVTQKSTIVFDNYIVTYTPNTANTTESNSDNWEYVGNEPIDHAKANGIVKQTIKYWDYSKPQYDFIAWATGEGINPIFSGTPDYGSHEVLISAITPDKAVKGENDEVGKGENQKMAYSFSGSADDLTKCYISDLVTVKKDDYQKPVTMKFRQLGAKVRMGIYETIPGYSVKDVQFYTVAAGALDDNTKDKPTLFTTTAGQIYNEGTYYIYFPSVDGTTADNNQAHIKFEGKIGNSDVEQKSTVDFTSLEYTIAEQGEPTPGKAFLGRTSNTASMAGQAQGNYYTQYLPNEEGTNLNLRVNYTLESVDGSKENILVQGATAQVPAIYTQWKAGYAYTYLFKISDRTNGHTGVYDPENPDDTELNPDPTGLYPITFDAVVVNAEDDKTQETITTVSTPSITTYQKGSKVVNNNEYLAATGDIYVTVNDGDKESTPDLANGKLQVLTGKATLYTVTGNATEAEVIDALTFREDDLPTGAVQKTIKGRNGLVLTPAELTLTTKVEYGVDGNIVDLADNDEDTDDQKAAKFTPTSGKTYVFVYTKTAPNGHTTLYQPVSFDNANVTTKCHYKYKEAYTLDGNNQPVGSDVKEGVTYFEKDNGGNYKKADVYLGQSASTVYRYSNGEFYVPKEKYVKSGVNYYYTDNNGQNYSKYRMLEYAKFGEAYIADASIDEGYKQVTANTKPQEGVQYFVKEGNIYYRCLILPQQTTNLYVLTNSREVATETTEVEGQTYFDRYYKYEGVYYSKVIKVQ